MIKNNYTMANASSLPTNNPGHNISYWIGGGILKFVTTSCLFVNVQGGHWILGYLVSSNILKGNIC